MTDIRDNPPPLPEPDIEVSSAYRLRIHSVPRIRQIEAAAFARGVAAGQASVQGEVDALKTGLEIIDSNFKAEQRENDELRAKLKALEEQKPVARLLNWRGPAHYPVPHGGVAARTFDEYPKEDADKADSYWKNGEPLYLAAGAKP